AGHPSWTAVQGAAPVSPLTKLFVVLNVLLSLVIVSALVVYVNKDDLQRDSITKVKAERDAAKQEAETLRAQVTAAQENLNAAQQQANQQATAASNEMLKIQNDLSKAQVDLATQSSKAAQQQLDVSRLTEALNATQAAAGKQTEEIARLRTSNDTLVKQS